ncbi:cell division protein FtsQ/DivIB [Nocardia harenae]|uniref:cell division protein FtsQ/DivIB n=1 Tax=Nocardia harenae TaxID=358707 RepID=UPI001FE17A26|nr:FtsQ-type POTRA domain-containing protein [Nocardia harenae]
MPAWPGPRSAREPRPRGRRGLPRLPVRLGLGVAVLVTAVAIAYFTPVFAVRTVRVDGAAAVPEDQVRAELGVPEGRSMLRIDTTAMAARVASIPKISTARVQRVFPGTVRVTVRERTPVLWFAGPGGAHLVDAEAVEYAVEPAPPAAPELTAAAPALRQAAVTVLTALPPALAAEVAKLEARSASDIALTLRDGRTVLWGGADDAARKAAVVGPLLTRDGTIFDVSSPNLVTVR